jgi:hypothetical protein
MTSRPIITVLLPWKFSKLAKTVQAMSKGNDRVSIGGNHQGMRITATIQDFLRLGLGKQDWDISDAMVGRLRSARVPVKASRTVRLPGGVTTVEISTDSDAVVAKKIAGTLADQGSADVVTIYDQNGMGHTGLSKGIGSKGAEVVGTAPRIAQGASQLKGRVARKGGSHAGLVEAIRNIWETNGDDFVMLLDWDQSEYETPDIQELIRGVLPQYLSDNLREEWDGLESEQQTAVVEEALPRNAIRETAETLDRHFENQTRGAARTLQASIDPLDLGLRDPERLVRVNGRGSLNDLFE